MSLINAYKIIDLVHMCGRISEITCIWKEYIAPLRDIFKMPFYRKAILRSY